MRHKHANFDVFASTLLEEAKRFLSAALKLGEGAEKRLTCMPV